MSARRWRGRSLRRREEGQSLVEFSLIVPVFLVILLGMVELGFAFDHLLTLGYASREGARAGAALADGGKLQSPYGCGDVDKFVIMAIERVLTSDGSPVASNLDEIGTVRIYRANSSGADTGTGSTWTPSVDGAGNPTGPIVDGRRLHFAQTGSNWNPCGRSNQTSNPDSIGVSITYTYRATTPLASVMRLVGGPGASTLAMTDRSVMALNPTD